MITGRSITGLAYIFTSVPQMPATSILRRAPSSGMSGSGNSRSSVLLGPVRTAASTRSAITLTLAERSEGLAMGLRTVTRTQGANAALKDGTVSPRGYPLDFEEVDPLIRAFRCMVRELEYDVCEL